jgi:hypothetical protein
MTDLDLTAYVGSSTRPYKHVDPEVMTRGRRQASEGGDVYRRNRTTRSGGIPLPGDAVPVKERRPGDRSRRMVLALVELARSRRRLAHVPTLMQVRALAHFAGREPSSYVLDPTVNLVPELPLGGEDPTGRYALRFTGECPHSGRRVELVTLPDGCAFDLLGMSR